MVKKLTLISLSWILSGNFVYGAGGNDQLVPTQASTIYISKIIPGDTALLNDSAAKTKLTLIHDPKQGFRDLFLNTSLSNGNGSAQLNPRAISFVEDYIQKHSDHLGDMKDWGKPYLDMMDQILTQHGLPKELKYLSVIESQLKSSAVSWVGAVGPWQFMPETAKRMGLRISGRNGDERRDFYKSTHAAAKYLTELYGIYSDWLLVVAAYNSGPGGVNKAIRKSGSRNFWDLQYYLPTESRNHVKKFIATHYIMEGQAGMTTMTQDETKNILFASAPAGTTVKKEQFPGARKLIISGKYNSLVISKHTITDIVTFNQMNPDFDRLIAANGTYEMRLPSEKMDLFNANKYQILNESMQLLLNTVQAEQKKATK